MTVSAQTPIKRSTANGVTTVFPYDFKILAAADLEVSLDGVVKTLTTDYTLSGVGDDAGGNVTMLSAPANGVTVVRRRNMAYTREVDYQDQGELPTDTLDDDQDAPILMIQQVAEGLSRAVSLPPESSGVSLTLPTPAALQYLRWNAAADALESVLLADVSLISLTAYAQTLLNAVDAAAARLVLGITTFGSTIVTAANAAAARTAMGAAASGANADITSLTGITSINGQQYARGGVRQTVNAGSVDANGLPNFLATSVNLNLPISAKATNLVIAAANGFNSNGPVDRIGVVTADTTLTVAASSSLYIYADVSAAGVVTFGSGTLAPSYITGGTPSTTNGQFTFDTTKKIGYVGNGSAAVQTYRVYLGEATTSGSAVTAVVNYALNGEYAQVDSGIPSQTRLSRNHNIGCTPRVWRLAVKCTSSDAGYAVGEEVSMYYANGNIMSESVTNLTYGIITNITTVGVVDKTAHTGANISSTNWDTVFYANRGW